MFLAYLLIYLSNKNTLWSECFDSNLMVAGLSLVYFKIQRLKPLINPKWSLCDLWPKRRTTPLAGLFLTKYGEHNTQYITSKPTGCLQKHELRFKNLLKVHLLRFKSTHVKFGRQIIFLCKKKDLDFLGFHLQLVLLLLVLSHDEASRQLASFDVMSQIIIYIKVDWLLL